MKKAAQSVSALQLKRQQPSLFERMLQTNNLLLRAAVIALFLSTIGTGVIVYTAVTGDRRQEIGGQRSEEEETGDRRQETGGQRSEVGGQRSEDGDEGMETGRQSIFPHTRFGDGAIRKEAKKEDEPVVAASPAVVPATTKQLPQVDRAATKSIPTVTKPPVTDIPKPPVKEAVKPVVKEEREVNVQLKVAKEGPKTVVTPPVVKKEETIVKTQEREVKKAVQVQEKQESFGDEKLFDEQDLEQLMGQIRKAKQERGIMSNCVQISHTRGGNNRRATAQIETYLRNQKFSIAGKEEITRKVNGVQVSDNGGCVKVVVGSF